MSIIVLSDQHFHFKLRILMLSTPLLTHINLSIKSRRYRQQTFTPWVSQGHRYDRWNKHLIKCLPIQAASCALEKCDGNCIYQSCFSVSFWFKKEGRIGQNCVCLHYAVIVSVFYTRNKEREICMSYFILNCQTFSYVHKRPSCFSCQRWQFEWKLRPLLSGILSGRRFKIESETCLSEVLVYTLPSDGDRNRRGHGKKRWLCFMWASSPCRGDTI